LSLSDDENLVNPQHIVAGVPFDAPNTMSVQYNNPGPIDISIRANALCAQLVAAP
jgi:hypothetical protein